LITKTWRLTLWTSLLPIIVVIVKAREIMTELMDNGPLQGKFFLLFARLTPQLCPVGM